MTNEWHIGEYVTKLKEKTLADALTVIGDFGVSVASQNFRTRGYSPATKNRTGNMSQNLSYATKKEKSSPGYGEAIEAPNGESVRIGGNVAYLARYEYGFVGIDSLGRHYKQKPRPILGPILDHKKEIVQIIQTALDNQK